jgi:capsular exopolysaccharide synthesis family protein
VGLVSQLETSRRGGTPAAAAVVVDDADYPIKPVGLKLMMRLALGAAGGLIVGMLAALLFGVLDKRLRARENIESQTGSLVMGALPKDPVRKNAGVVDLAGNGLYAERVRELRTNLRFTVPPEGSGPLRCIAVTSPSAGDGRTTTAIDLAAALAESGRSVILIDGDMRNPAIADRLLDGTALLGAHRTGLSTVLVGEDDVSAAVISHVGVGDYTITVLPAGPLPPRPGELWATDRATQLLEYLAGAFDYVVVDTPPLGDYTDGAIVGALGDGAILLARIGGTTERALRRAVQVLQSAHVALLGTVVTFEPVSRVAMRAHAKRRGRTAVENRESETPVAGRTAVEDRESDTRVGSQVGRTAVENRERETPVESQ